MSDLMLKIVGAVLVLLPITAFFVYAYKDLGQKAFMSMLKGMAIGLIYGGSMIAGLALLGLIKK